MCEKIKFENLELLRKSRNMTVEDLMNHFGYDRATYYQSWLKGNIKMKDIIKLHEFFNVSTDCILDIKPITILG